MQELNNLALESSSGKTFGVDILYNENQKPKPVIIFSHGFKGFKNWGAYNQVAAEFAQTGFVFVRFNYSHNGTSFESPEDFVDLEAFGNNTYSQELSDLDMVIDAICAGKIIPPKEIDLQKLYLVGHSRGGAISIIQAGRDDRIAALVTWAAVNDLARGWTPEIAADWKAKGVRYSPNKRTGQLMPLNYSLYADYDQNRSELDVARTVRHLKKPFMAVHGSDDEIPLTNAIEMKQWNPAIKLEIIPGGDHTFGVRHPWPAEEDLPQDMAIAIKRTIQFFKS